MISVSSGFRIRSKLFLSALSFGLAGCTNTSSAPATQSAVSAVQQPGTIAPTPLAPVTNFSLPSEQKPRVSGFEVLGSGAGYNLPANAAPQIDGAGGITFDFVNANVTDVARTIFSEVLKQNYTIDGGVQGTITLQTTRPLSKDQVIPALETSLKMANMALVHEADGYHIAPLANAAQVGAGNLSVAGSSQMPGYGYEIIPLKYASADAVDKLIQPLVQSGVQIQVDSARNLLIVGGTSQDRASIAANVAVFDVNWLAGMSYALVPLQTASAATVAKEVEQFMGGSNSPMAGLVRLVVISQLNSVLVISPQRKYLNQIKDLIGRLDEEQKTTDRQVYVYHLQNGDARSIAGILNQLMGQSTASNSTSPANSSSDEGAGDNNLSQPMQATSSQGPISTGGVDAANSGLGNATQALLQNANNLDGSVSATMSSNDGNSSTDSEGGQGAPRIIADESDNDLLIYATSDQYQSIQSAISQLDVQPKQVMLEAVVAEVDLTNELRYGIQYSVKSGNFESVNTLGKTASLLEDYPGFSAMLAPGENIQVLLNALDSITHVTVMSAPKLMVLNNQPAELNVGDDVPILSQTAQSTDSATAPLVSTIQYQNTGVILHVTPRINDGGLVDLDISQEVSSVSTTTSSSLNSPTISERKLSTIVAVPDGRTVALGGMIQTNDSHDNSGVPLLDKIPGLGILFSNKDNSSTRTELLVFITPHVVQSTDAMLDITNELRSQMTSVETMQ